MVDWRGHLRAFGAALIALPLVWWPVVSLANPYIMAWNVIKSASGGKVALPTASNLLRQFQLGGAALSGLPGGGVKAAGTVALPVANTAIGGLIGSTVGRSALLTGAAKVATWTVPGAAIAAALEYVRCRPDGTSLAGLIECEQGQEETLQEVVRYRWAQGQYASSHQAGAEADCATVFATWPYNGCKSVTLASAECTPNSGVCSWNIEANNGAKLYGRATYREVVNQLQCPANMIKVAGLCWTEDPAGGLLGPTVETGADDLGNRFLDWRNQPGWPSAATDLELAKDIAKYDGPNEPIPAPAVSTEIENQPGSVPGGSKVSTKVNADGTKTQTTTTTTYNVTYNGDTYYVTTTTSTTIQNFDENDDPLGPPVTETETDTPPVTDPGLPEETPEDLECGLPGYPPCKIDEQGTPPPEDPFEEPDEWFDPIRGVFDNPPAADTSWTWSFSLPSSCSVLTVGSFGGHTVTLDLCQWQPMIHSIVSMVWLIAGIWVGVGMVGRTLGGT